MSTTDSRPALHAEPDQIAAIRSSFQRRDWRIELCAETGRYWLVDRAAADPEHALIAEVLCPNPEPLQAVLNEDIPHLLAEIDHLRAQLGSGNRAP
ncbi:hypothetical protein ACWEN6_25115 [Sphaerisporangium sp. NPDC004334]